MISRVASVNLILARRSPFNYSKLEKCHCKPSGSYGERSMHLPDYSACWLVVTVVIAALNESWNLIHAFGLVCRPGFIRR
jgi:hypothetical protein